MYQVAKVSNTEGFLYSIGRVNLIVCQVAKVSSMEEFIYYIGSQRVNLIVYQVAKVSTHAHVYNIIIVLIKSMSWISE